MSALRLATNEVFAGARTFRAHVRNRRVYESVANPYSSIWIDPAEVRAKVNVRYRELPPGTILGGDWDLEVSNFADSPKYQGLVERFRLGMRWEETVLFRQTYRVRLEQTGSVLGLRSLDEVVRYYCQTVDPLYESIRLNGFSPGSWRHRIRAAFVHIGRGGEILWGTGGNHRLAIAKILELQRIPVRVHIRHQHWQTLRDQLTAGVAPIDPATLAHPDLADSMHDPWPQSPITSP